MKKYRKNNILYREGVGGVTVNDKKNGIKQQSSNADWDSWHTLLTSYNAQQKYLAHIAPQIPPHIIRRNQ